jgi:hypothetical protein
VVRKGSVRPTPQGTHQNWGMNDTVWVTEVKRIEGHMMRIINVYDQRDVQTGVRRARKLNWHSAI